MAAHCRSFAVVVAIVLSPLTASAQQSGWSAAADGPEVASDDPSAEGVASASDFQTVSYNCPRCGRGRNSRCRCRPPCRPQTVMPSTEPEAAPDETPAEPVPEDEAAPMEEAQDVVPEDGLLASSLGAPRSPISSAPNMLGDFIPGGSLGGSLTLAQGLPGFNRLTFALPYGGQGSSEPAVPYAFRTFKIADNESPWPQNRFFLTSNYFDHVGDTTAITRQMMGFERTFWSRRASLGMRLPFYTVDPDVQQDPFFRDGQIGTFGAGTNTQSDIGDLTVILKYSPFITRTYGNVFTVGMAVTTPTGPDTFADVDPLYTVEDVEHRGSIQTFMGFYRSLGNAWDGLFIHGFSAIDSPFDGDDATMWFNDIGLGYFMRRPAARGLTAIVPTCELHVNTPIEDERHNVVATQRLFDLSDLSQLGQIGGFNQVLGQIQYHDQVNITSGLTLLFNRRTSLACGLVVPVAGPKPYDYEVQLQLNMFNRGWWPSVR